MGSQASHVGFKRVAPHLRPACAPPPHSLRGERSSPQSKPSPWKKIINTKNSQPRSPKREARSGVGDSTPRAGALVPRVWAKLTVAGRSHVAPTSDEAYPWPLLAPPWRAVAFVASWPEAGLGCSPFAASCHRSSPSLTLCPSSRSAVTPSMSGVWAGFCTRSSWWPTGSAVARRPAAWIYERVVGVHGGAQIEN